MTTAAAPLTTRDPFMPQRPPGLKSGLALALLAHALLIAGLAYSVDWHTSTPEAVEAELWSALPQQAAPRAVSPPPPPPAPAPTPAPPAPAPKPQPVQPPPPPQVDPQIAIEKAREAKRVQQQEELAEQEKARRDKARRDQAKQDQDRKLAEQQARDEAQRKKQLAEKQQADRAKIESAKADQAKADKAEAAQREKDRLAALKRMQSLAGATGEANATGSALRSSGPSASYGGRVVARIKPNIVFTDTVDGNPAAVVEVKVAPDGTITGRRVVESSGVKAWDDAVLRAIDRTDGLPRDIDGRVPPLLSITFRPRDQ